MNIDFNELRKSKKNIRNQRLKFFGAILGMASVVTAVLFSPIPLALAIVLAVVGPSVYVGMKTLSEKTLLKANNKILQGLKLTKLEKMSRDFHKLMNNYIIDVNLVETVKNLNKGSKVKEPYYSLIVMDDNHRAAKSIAESSSLSCILEKYNDKLSKGIEDLRSKKVTEVSLALGYSYFAHINTITKADDPMEYFIYKSLSIDNAEETEKVLAFTSDYLKEVKRAESYDKMLANIAKIVKAQDQNIVEVKPEIKKLEIVQQEFKSTKSNEETEDKEKNK